MMNVKVYGVAELNQKLDQIVAVVQENVDNTIDLFTSDMTKEVKDSAPYDTGRYMSSWYYERVEPMTYAIINRHSDVPYNIYLVYGVSKFKSIAFEPRYKYADSERGIIHDIRQIKFIYSIKFAQLIKRTNLLSAGFAMAGL